MWYSPDKHPILGPTPVKNVFVGTGYPGHGFMLGPIVGKLLAHYIIHGIFFLGEPTICHDWPTRKNKA